MRKFSASGNIRKDMSVPYEWLVWLGREEENDLAAPAPDFENCATGLQIAGRISAYGHSPPPQWGAGGKVHAFEPNPVTFLKLQENIRLNRLENVVRGFRVSHAWR